MKKVISKLLLGEHNSFSCVAHFKAKKVIKTTQVFDAENAVKIRLDGLTFCHMLPGDVIFLCMIIARSIFYVTEGRINMLVTNKNLV